MALRKRALGNGLEVRPAKRFVGGPPAWALAGDDDDDEAAKPPAAPTGAYSVRKGAAARKAANGGTANGGGLRFAPPSSELAPRKPLVARAVVAPQKPAGGWKWVPDEDDGAGASGNGAGAEHRGGLQTAGNAPLRSSAVERYRRGEKAVQAVSKGGGRGRGAQGIRGASWGRASVAKVTNQPFQRVFLALPKTLSKADRTAMESMRAELDITVEDSSGSEFPPVATFEELAGVVPEYVLSALTEAGIEEPMAIQKQALPMALGGRDLVGIARTGSGKTLAYLLPAIVHIEAQEPLRQGACTPIALILAPTRELAVQIAEEGQKVLQASDEGSHPSGIHSVALFGGGSQNKSWQIQALKEGCHIVAATPGRLVDLLDMGACSMSRVTYLVLDEADRMLEEGFGDQVGSIVSKIRPDRQTLFFSATWPAEVQELADNMCHDEDQVATVTVGQSQDGSGPTTRDDIVQEVVVFDQPNWDQRDKEKMDLMYDHLREVMSDPAHKILVFVSRKTLADELCNRLWDEGFKTHAMHGGKSQDSRLDILDQFRRSEITLLVTTDVMGRGLDIPDVSHVVVYDMGDIEDYVHRIGRTARGPYGSGHALTFFEYDKKWPQIPGQLVEVLEQSGQEVPEDLVQIAQEVADGTRDATWGKNTGGW